MSLLERQRAFRTEIAAADDAGPEAANGMQIYRDAYRGRLLAALEASFARTRRWVGDQAFIAAACHYILTHPPRGWTLDTYGAEFPQILAKLFADDPEVAELGWLEWHMQQAFAARDKPRLDPVELAAAGYGESDWDRMQFTFAPGFALQRLTTNCLALWHQLERDPPGGFAVERDPDCAVVVWREACSPNVRQLQQDECDALAAMADGATLGSIGAVHGPELLGQWLAQWLGEGLISQARPGPAGANRPQNSGPSAACLPLSR